MQYKDGRGWLFEARQGAHISGWSIHCYNPKKKLWYPWPCCSWYGSQKEVERQLLRYAKLRGWQKVEAGNA